MLLMTSSKLLQAAFPSWHDAAHDVIKAASGCLPQLTWCCAWSHQSCFRLPWQGDMMLLMSSSKLLQAAFPSCHDAAHDVIKAAWCAPPLKYSTISWASGRPFLLATFVPQMLAGKGDIFSTILENVKFLNTIFIDLLTKLYYLSHYISIKHKEYVT